MTDTDLIAAGSGAEEPDLPTTATPDISTSAPVDVPARAPQGDGALATMVLPELRALANEVGVKGTSGMRKNELIAAIRERRGEPIGKAHNGESTTTDNTDSSDESSESRATEGTQDEQEKADADKSPSDRSPSDKEPVRQVDRRGHQAGDPTRRRPTARRGPAGRPEPRRRRR